MDPTQLPLRDIHFPDPVNWWPPAIGWWWLLVLIILLVIAGIKLFQYRNKIKYSPVNMAKQSLQSIRSKYTQDGDAQYLIREISSLMRRLCISIFPRQETASLVGDDWLLFLDKSMKHSTKGHMSESQPESDNLFTEGVGRVLSEGPYSKQTEGDGEQLLSLCETWISQVAKKSSLKKLRDSKK
ncbi:MAG: hypothetical protein ACI9ZT_001071 [Gammaproteobacteria bacterium]|jgi:hypothetical protein